MNKELYAKKKKKKKKKTKNTNGIIITKKLLKNANAFLKQWRKDNYQQSGSQAVTRLTCEGRGAWLLLAACI
jgi:hypothetical protein